MGSNDSQHEVAASALRAVRALVQNKSFRSAALRLGEWRRHLERRLDTEGRLVPIFVSRTGDPRGLAFRLKEEQERLLADVNAVSVALARCDSVEALLALDCMSGDYESHLVTEAEMMHPALDDFALDDFDWDGLHYLLPNADFSQSR